MTLSIIIVDKEKLKEPIVIVKDCEYTIQVTNDYEDVTATLAGPIIKRTGTTLTIRMTEEGPLKP